MQLIQNKLLLLHCGGHSGFTSRYYLLRGGSGWFLFDKGEELFDFLCFMRLDTQTAFLHEAYKKSSLMLRITADSFAKRNFQLKSIAFLELLRKEKVGRSSTRIELFAAMPHHRRRGYKRRHLLTGARLSPPHTSPPAGLLRHWFGGHSRTWLAAV